MPSVCRLLRQNAGCSFTHSAPSDTLSIHPADSVLYMLLGAISEMHLLVARLP